MFSRILFCLFFLHTACFFSTGSGLEVPAKKQQSTTSHQGISPSQPVTSNIVEGSIVRASGYGKCKARISDYSNFVVPISEKYGMDPQLVTAVMAAESNFDPCAKSSAGAVGLMQITPQTAGLYKLTSLDLYDPEKNIRAGVRHLKMLSKRYNGDLELTLAAYNAGEGTVDRYNGVPPYAETRTYVRRVLDYHADLREARGPFR